MELKYLTWIQRIHGLLRVKKNNCRYGKNRSKDTNEYEYAVIKDKINPKNIKIKFKIG